MAVTDDDALSLVIDGDVSGAKKALEETVTGIEELGKTAETAGKKVESLSKGIQWNDAEFDRARNGLKSTAEEGERAAESVSAVAQAGTRAAPEIVKIGEAAETAGGKFSGLSSVVIGAAGGLAAGIAITAIGEGLKAAAGFAGDLFEEIVSNAPQIERALEAHAGLVGRIKGAWAEAEGAASSYGLSSVAQLRFESQQNVGRLETAFGGALGDLQTGILHPNADPHGGSRSNLGPLQQEVRQFREELKSGETDVLSFRRRISEIAEALPAESPLRPFTEELLQQTQAAAELQAELSRSRDLLDGLKGDAEAAATALGGKAEKYRELTDDASAAGDAIGGSTDQIGRAGGAAAAANPELAEFDRLMKSIASGGAPEFMTTRQAVTTPLIAGPGFAGGGWTGNGATDKVAGFVHGQEYVFDAETTARIGVGNLDAIRAGVRGYAAGGFVGSVPMAGGSSGGGNIVGGLTAEFRMLQGTVHQFGAMLWRTGDAGQVLGSVIQSVSQRFLDFSLRALDQVMFGSGGGAGNGGFGLVGQLFGMGGGTGYFPSAPASLGVGLYHGGGRVGGAPAMSRMVSSSVFMDAPRSSELRSGERPLIAMDGEDIGWPDQLARKYGGGSTVINNFHVETPNPKAFAESRSTVARAAGRLAARSGRHS